MLLPVQIDDLESVVRSCRSSHTVECSRDWCFMCFCAAAGGSFFQCGSNDLFYNRLHAEVFPEVVSNAPEGEVINDPANKESMEAVISENHTTTLAEMQTLLARIALVNEEGDILGIIADIQEWLLSRPDAGERNCIKLCVALSELYKDSIGKARMSERTLVEKLEETRCLLANLQEHADKNTPDIEEIHALLARIESTHGVEDVEDVISSTEDWLDQQQNGVSLKSLCAALAELCRCKADEARSSRNNEERLLVTLHEVRQISEALRTDQKKNMPAAEDIQRLLVCISLVSDDSGNTLLEKEELETIDEIRDWFAVRPDAAINNSVSKLGYALSQLCRAKTSKTWALRRSLQESLSSKECLEKQLDEELRKSREKEAEFVYRWNESQAAISALTQELHQAKLALNGLTSQLNEVSQRYHQNEANFVYRLNEAQAVNMNLQRELYQARLPVYMPANLQPPYAMPPTDPDVEYIRMLGRNYRC